MNKQTTTNLLIISVILTLALTASGCGTTGYSPSEYARATAIAQSSASKAAAAAVSVQATATMTAQVAQERERTAPARAAGVALIWLALGVGVGVLMIGGAFGVIALICKRVMAIYPNSAGQYPVIVRRDVSGLTIVHDPNRAVGPTTVYATPSLLAQIAILLGAQPPQAQVYGQQASEGSYLQVASQAQAVGLMAAATRPQGLLGGLRTPSESADLVRSVTASGSRVQLPPVEVATDLALIEAVKQLEAAEDV